MENMPCHAMPYAMMGMEHTWGEKGVPSSGLLVPVVVCFAAFEAHFTHSVMRLFLVMFLT